MTAVELYLKLEKLLSAGHGEETVYLDTNPHDLFVAGDIDLDTDGVGIIIWKE